MLLLPVAAGLEIGSGIGFRMELLSRMGEVARPEGS